MPLVTHLPSSILLYALYGFVYAMSMAPECRRNETLKMGWRWSWIWVSLLVSAIMKKHKIGNFSFHNLILILAPRNPQWTGETEGTGGKWKKKTRRQSDLINHKPRRLAKISSLFHNLDIDVTRRKSNIIRVISRLLTDISCFRGWLIMLDSEMQGLGSFWHQCLVLEGQSHWHPHKDDCRCYALVASMISVKNKE